MNVTEALPWLNLLLVPTLTYVVGIEKRLTRLEAIREAERQARDDRGVEAAREAERHAREDRAWSRGRANEPHRGGE